MFMPPEGFCIIPGVLPSARNLAEEADDIIHELAAELGIQTSEYLSAVNVWWNRSRVVQHLYPSLLEAFTRHLGSELKIIQTSFIRKSLHSPHRTAAHQDATYSNNKPYLLNAWVALDDVGPENSPLELLAGSHEQPPSHWVNYLAPGFIDTVSSSAEWKRSISVEVKAGDLVLMDPFLWHSTPPLLKGVRRAVALRLSREGVSWKQPIPSYNPPGFGIFTARKLTEEALRSFISKNDQPSSFLELLDLVVEKTQDPALNRLRILIKSETQDAGDQQGHVYSEAWKRIQSGELALSFRY